MRIYLKIIGAVLLTITLTTMMISFSSREESETTEVTTCTEAEPGEATEHGKINPLKINIKNLPSADAPVTIAVYGTNNKFPDPKSNLKTYKFTPEGCNLTAEITDLKFGTYALAIYQDENNNGKFDKSRLGVPKEAYALSNDFKPKMKPPKFSQCQFEYGESTKALTINMID